MARKSVREMDKHQRRRHSINSKTFIITLLLTLGIGVTVLLVGFGLYLNSTYYQVCISMWNSANAEAVILNEENITDKCNQILDIFDSFTEEERGDGSSEEYKAAFYPTVDGKFRKIQREMNELLERNGPLDAFVIAVDQRNSRIIYLIDADLDPNTFVPPGQWDAYKPSDLEIMVNGRSRSRVEKHLDVEGDVQAVMTNIQPYGLRCTGSSTLFQRGDYTVMVCVDEKLEGLAAISLMFLEQYVLVLLAVVLIASFFGTWLMRRNLVRPINRMAKAAQEYTGDKQKLANPGAHFADLDIHTGDELENLAVTMQEMEAELATYVDNLTKAAAEKERINTELSLAARIQESMLPGSAGAFPENDEFDICASMEAAKVVGGDFYDFYLLDDDHLVVEIADVAGKGIPASLFMMASKLTLTEKVRETMSPGEALANVNNTICENNPEEMFVTVWLGILELSTGRLVTANAGHEFPILIHADGTVEMIQDKHGFVIGGMENMKYKEWELQLSPGDRIFVYTDGVTEATSKEDELFGMDRLLEAAGEAGPDADPQQVMQVVRSAIARFVEDNEQFDDLTMLCLQYLGKE